MKLIIQPDAGVEPLLAAIRGAKRSVEVTVFRFDRKDVELALKTAAKTKGVRVSALIAFTNRGGETRLRDLEQRFLNTGIIVARSSNDLVRYHDKFVIIDRRLLYVLSFNFTHADIDRSRGFGVVTTYKPWVSEAVRLFRSDSTRTPFRTKSDTFVVSPANSRKVLGAFIRRARKQLLIYDPKIADREMLNILNERAKAGVDIKVIGSIAGRVPFETQKLSGRRLHTRTIIRDRREVFIGSQSLRTAELDDRRELGVIIHDPKSVKKVIETFESDWIPDRSKKKGDFKVSKIEKTDKADKAAKVFTQGLDPLADTVKKAVRKAVAKAGQDVLHDEDVKDTMKKVVKKAMKDAVKEAVETAKAVEKSN